MALRARCSSAAAAAPLPPLNRCYLLPPPPARRQVRKSLKLRGEPAVALLNSFSWNATRDMVKVRGAEVGMQAAG